MSKHEANCHITQRRAQHRTSIFIGKCLFLKQCSFPHSWKLCFCDGTHSLILTWTFLELTPAEFGLPLFIVTFITN